MKTIRYVALGDSLTFGYGVSGEASFPEVLRKLAEHSLDCPVELHNAGIVGATASDTAQLLHTDPALQAKVKTAELITITVGGNDLLNAARVYYTNGDAQLLTQALKTYLHAVRELLGRISEVQGGSEDCAIRLLGLYNPFPEIEEADYWVRRLNRLLTRFHKRNVCVIQLYDVFESREEGLISDDMVHPTAEGYEQMALKTADAGYSPLDTKLCGMLNKD
ncbi:GDSL-type esterase/lipase family protein [Paenibacillus turpanensis]|uniref:GDSL-type esterase/lipase family protein n=1 Tax=Paenibacillus turpanensis TaxID=2689078 RepID=UPI00140C226C|nr:GDSL-type esterase/lipase family protein [Paenibacillus turpanensis]